MKKLLFACCIALLASCSKELSNEKKCGIITNATDSTITVNGTAIKLKNKVFNLPGPSRNPPVYIYKVGDTYCIK